MNSCRRHLVKSFYVLGTVVLCSCSASSSPVDQPIQYNHSLHVQQEEIECVECHVGVATYARATIPNIEICGECHSEEPNTESPEELKLIEYVDSNTRIPWRKVYSVGDNVYFSHVRHTEVARIDCGECHGDVEQMTHPFTRQPIVMNMDRCVGCHEENNVTTDCVNCHR